MPNGPGSDDRAKRTPMRWRGGAGGGFTDATPWTPFSTDDPAVSVRAQRADPTSLWWSYRRLIALRRLHPALDRGDSEVLDAGARALLAVARRVPGDDLVVVANLASRPVPIDAGALGIEGGVELLGGARVGADAVVPGLALWVVRRP